MTAPTRKEAVARPARRGPADPVRALMHRHQELCAHAVDPLDIAAGLEAHGVTDRTAARCRHRDVFSLAEELYARVPRADEPAAAAAPAAERAPRSRGVRAALQLLPGAVCAATLAALDAVEPSTPLTRPAVTAAGGVLVALAVRLAVRTGPLRARRPGGGAAVLWICWTVGYAVYGDWLLTELQGGGPDLPPHPRAAAATAVALACAVAPAAGCARWFARRGRRGLAASCRLTELAARIRPLLLGATALFLGALAALLTGARAVLGGIGTADLAAAAALGVLLFLARLLSVHGYPGAAAAGLATAAALEALAPALVLTARLPGLTPLGAPVEELIRHTGTAGVPALACAAAALGLLAYGLRALTGAWAHSPSVPAEAGRP
ncbi:hypothetical protein [Streptomyces sp. NPDC053427]|uniref:hypothetical protein n=1 Tax=Streptomyces sp. NPDC053427 TaxID=3365701 RepID=UPI0037D68076